MVSISRRIIRSLLPVLAAFPALSIFSSSAKADTIELITGEVIEGKILRETPDHVIIKTRFSETIMEDRPIPREKIKNIKKIAPDEFAFAELEKLELPETAFTPEAYEAALKPLRGFLQEFGYSSRVPAVREKVRAIEAEQQKVAEGAIKLNGRLYNPDELGEAASEIETFRRVTEIQKMAEGGDLAGAINAFFVFAKDNSGSLAFVGAVEQAQGYIRALIGVLEHEIRNSPILEKRREEQVALASPENRSSMEAARARQIEDLQNAVSRSKEEGAVIPPYARFSLASLKEAHTAANLQLQKLNDLNLAAMQRSVKLLGEAEVFFEERELQGSLQRVQQSLDAWPENAAAQRFQENLQGEIERRESADAHQAQAVTDGFTSSTADPDATPSNEETTD